MLKCKNRWMPEGRVFEKNEIFVANLSFHYYNMAKDEALLQGLYMKGSTNDEVEIVYVCFFLLFFLLLSKK